MSQQTCANCLYQETILRNEVLCLVDKDWYEKDNTCENYRKYTAMNEEVRVAIANEVRRRIDEKESRKASQKFQIRLAVLTYLLGYMSAIVYRLIFP